MRCRVCREKAAIEVRRHNAAFCKDHFIEHFRRQVERAIHDHEMFAQSDRLLLGVSGGKDSLALWDVLTELGYEADGVYLDLGITGYSPDGLAHSRTFAEGRGLRLSVVDLQARFGFSVPQAAGASRRSPCSACGLSKRYILNKVALDGGYDVLVTGHNLDDEAATLFGNVMRWETEYLGRQRPLLEAGEGLVRKAKPLIRVAERETAAYAVLSGIEYEIEECPMAGGNTINRQKEWLARLEEESPGTKTRFVQGFFERAAARFDEPEPIELAACERCGQATTSTLCAFCRLSEVAGGQG